MFDRLVKLVALGLLAWGLFIAHNAAENGRYIFRVAPDGYTVMLVNTRTGDVSAISAAGENSYNRATGRWTTTKAPIHTDSSVPNRAAE
jgi:hypothetical protein